MKTVEVCIGSGCHLKGSYDIIDCYKKKIEMEKLKEEVELKPYFCSGNCQHSVSIKICDKVYSVSPNSADTFFESEIKSTYGKGQNRQL